MLVEKRIITISQIPYTFSIHIEKRNSIRASIGKRGVNIRVPKMFNKIKQSEQIQKLINWAIAKITKNPPKFEKKNTYEHLDVLQALNRSYTLHIIIRDSEKNFTKLNGDIIEFKIARKHRHHARQKYISKQLQKILAENHLDELRYRVRVLNQMHFNKQITKVSFQYTKSRWGSCSSRGELKLSTRLLLAPSQVLNYVIIHELAHLIHMNHSYAFWGLVREADPLYKEKTKWLKAYGHKLVI